MATIEEKASPAARFSYMSSGVLGLGMFGISLAAGIYNSYVPLFIRHYVPSAAIIGLIVSVRTLMGVVLNTYFSARSDRTQTRFGRRLPYILIGMPVTGILFMLFPWQIGAAFLIVVDLVYAVASNVFYAPTIALMPDVTPAPRRSQANGIINAMAGLAALLAFFIGPALFHMGRPLPFLVVGVLFFIIPFIMWRGIREPAIGAPSSDGVGIRHLLHAARRIVARPDRTALLLLAAVFFWSGGESSVETFFVTYGVYHLHLASATAVITIGLFALAYLIFAVPSGFLAARLTRRRLVLGGTVGLALAFFALSFLSSVWPIRAFALVGGFFWAFININGYPWFTTLAEPADVGAFTGLWLMAAGLGNFVCQPAIGFLMDRLGYPWLFYGAAASVLLGFLAVLFTPRRKVLAS
ncbi:MFS transporter [Sulfobacillus harzensis]|uniref:SLC45 family MFS transporter n=1 Tax=Sulfobacillus harzensis TaxID=2729629 RepID=A0A7Y0LAH1_9FIRM|nr:MFS transporter [Sulfobacillus harzensis]NMP24849.1 SLC45 family MFS transporter [Sulfobacillus harzensis]